MYGNCGAYCDPADISKEDRKALLNETQAILEAKLATVKQMIKNLDLEKETEKD